MAIGPRLEMRQSQSLVMTPQLRQAIKLLQFSNLEVSAFVEEELQRNPLLERDERTDGGEERAAPDQLAAPVAENAELGQILRTEHLPSAEAQPLDAPADSWHDMGTASDGYIQGRGGNSDFDSDGLGIEALAQGRPSLRDRLAEQLRLGIHDPVDRLIGAHLIALLDPSGRLASDPGAIATALAVDLARVEAVRAKMQRFEPVGMFCRSLKECLAVQLAERNHLDPAMAALLENLELLARRDLRQLMAICGVDAEDMADMVAELKSLDPKPGAGEDESPVHVVVADVLLYPAPDGSWQLELNTETMPRLLINRGITTQVSVRADRATKLYLAEHLASANWLVRSLQQRAQTILKVSAEIVRRQDAFFRHGVTHLRPLILRDIAEAVELHESTVSRVTANKYIGTPRGTFELKYFFTTAIAGTHGGESHSAEAIRHRIREMVGAEEADAILSDDAIVIILRREGVDIARRTVAKYREALRIPSSVQRRREKSVPA